MLPTWKVGKSLQSRKIFYLQGLLIKILRKFSRNSKKKHKLEKGRENIYQVLGKIYFKLNKILNKICEILEQILKRLEFL